MLKEVVYDLPKQTIALSEINQFHKVVGVLNNGFKLFKYVLVCTGKENYWRWFNLETFNRYPDQGFTDKYEAIKFLMDKGSCSYDVTIYILETTNDLIEFIELK